jgi:hypothetical protein
MLLSGWRNWFNRALGVITQHVEGPGRPTCLQSQATPTKAAAQWPNESNCRQVSGDGLMACGTRAMI